MSASRQKKLRQEKNEAVSEIKKRKLTEEQKSAKQLKLWTAVFYVVIGAMVLGLLVAGFVNTGILHRMLPAATVGEHKLSAAEMNYFYCDTVNGDYILPYMVDTTKTLDEQEYEEGVTFADHYMEQAMNNAATTYAIYDEAMANGFELSEEEKSSIEQNLNTMKTYAGVYGFSNVSGLLRANYGIGCNEKTYAKYLEINAIAQGYAQSVSEAQIARVDEIAANIAEHAAEYSAYSYALLTLNVKDYYEGEPDAEGKYTDEQTAAAKAAAKEAADAKAAELKGNKEAMLAEENVLEKKNVAYDSVASSLQEWMTSADRVEGDITAVEDGSGNSYYVAMYLGTNDHSKTQLVNVRHILIAPKGEAGQDGSYTAEQMEAAHAEAQEILDAWKSGVATEDSFALLANEKSTDTGSNTNGGLYEDVFPGQMVEAFDAWCFDESRKTGDTGLVETNYGVHIMYFVDRSEQNYQTYQAENAIVSEKYDTWYSGVAENYTVTEGIGMRMTKKDIMVQAPSYQ